MTTRVRYIGLDVHKDSIVIAVADEGSAPAEILAGIPHELPKLIKRLRELGPAESLRCCYEAGPTGYGLYRALSRRGSTAGSSLPR